MIVLPCNSLIGMLKTTAPFAAVERVKPGMEVFRVRDITDKTTVKRVYSGVEVYQHLAYSTSNVFFH